MQAGRLDPDSGRGAALGLAGHLPVDHAHRVLVGTPQRPPGRTGKGGGGELARGEVRCDRDRRGASVLITPGGQVSLHDCGGGGGGNDERTVIAVTPSPDLSSLHDPTTPPRPPRTLRPQCGLLVVLGALQRLLPSGERLGRAEARLSGLGVPCLPMQADTVLRDVRLGQGPSWLQLPIFSGPGSGDGPLQGLWQPFPAGIQPGTPPAPPPMLSASNPFARASDPHLVAKSSADELAEK